MTERLAEVVCLNNSITFSAPALGEVARRQLREQLFFGVSPEALDVELVEAAIGQEHLHLARGLI